MSPKDWTRPPDLAGLNAQIAAKARENKSDRRAYWSPDVVAFGEMSRVFDEDRVSLSGISLEDQTNWQAGVQISLPLFEGGARAARSSKSALALEQLSVNYQSSQDIIRQRVRGDFHHIRASYPSIALAKQAAVAARKSFDLVRENYTEGTRSMTDLLVSQNASLTADQSAANAVYRFLLDLMSLQRDIGAFDFFLDDSQQVRMIDRLKAYIARGQRPA